MELQNELNKSIVIVILFSICSMQLYHWKIILLKQNPFIVKISDSCIIYFILYIAKELKPKT